MPRSRLGLMVLGVLLALASSEVALRALAAAGVRGVRVTPQVLPDRVHWHEAGQPFVWTGRPGLPGDEFRTEGRWNRWGFNDREPGPARPGETRILVVGDSYVEALQVPQDRSFWRVAERTLASSGWPTRWVGLGVSSQGAARAADLVEQYGPAVQPAVVIYALSYNDVRDDFAPWAEAQRRWATPHRWLAPGETHSLLIDQVRFRLWRGLSRLRSTHPYPVVPEFLTFSTDGTFDVAAAYAAFFEGVDRMRSFSGRIGAPLVVVELPSGAAGYEEEICRQLQAKQLPCDVDGPRRRLALAATAHGFTFVSPKREMDAELAAGHALAYRWDGHYTERGHAVVGRVLAGAVGRLLEGSRSSDSGRR